MTMKRIVFFINSLKTGGAERVCVTLANNFVEKGIHVVIIVLHLKDSILKSELDPRVGVIDLKSDHARYAIFRLYRWIWKLNPSKIISFSSQLTALLVLVRWISRNSFKIISRNVTNLSKARGLQKSVWHKNIVFFFLMRTYAYVDKYIAQTEKMKMDMVRTFSLNPQKIVVIHNPVNPNLLKQYGSNVTRNKEILFVGRLCSEKAIDELLNIFKDFHKVLPEYKLRIVGDGPLKESLQQLASTLGFEDAVIWEGAQIKLAPYYQQARVVVLTSIYEGFPNVLIESVSLGTPVVAYDCISGPSEIIIDGLNGYLIENLNKKMFKEKLLQAVNDNWNYELVKESAKEFSADKIATVYLKEIQNA